MSISGDTIEMHPKRDIKDIEVDGIPVGLDYGIRIEEIDRPPLVPWLFRAPLIMESSRLDRWLIHWNGWEWEDVRKLPPDATVTFNSGKRRMIYYGDGRCP